MPYSDSIITAPVSIYDVQRALATSENDLGRIIANGAINMWAKFKPVRKNVISTSNYLNANNDGWRPDTDYNWNNPPWWAGTPRQTSAYGLNFSNAMAAGRTDLALNALATKVNGNDNGWSYERPVGGTSSPFRLIDFLKYRANAPRPVSGVTGSPQVWASASSKWKYEISLREVNAGAITDRDYLVPMDIASYTSLLIGNMTVGLVIYRRTETTYNAIAWCTGQEWFGNGIEASTSTNPDVTIGDTTAIAHFKNGVTYYALPVYFSELTIQPIAGGSRVRAPINVFTVPYTNFIPVLAVKRDTIGTVAVVTLTSRIIDINNNNTLALKVNLDATDPGYTGGTFAGLIVGVVNELWSPSDWNSPPAGSTKYWQTTYDESHRHVDQGAITVADQRSITFTSGDLASHTWMVVAKTTSPDDEYYFPLIQPVQPYA